MELAIAGLWAYVASRPLPDFPPDDFLGTLLLYTFAHRLLTMMFLWMLWLRLPFSTQRTSGCRTLDDHRSGHWIYKKCGGSLRLLPGSTFTKDLDVWTPALSQLAAILGAGGLILLIRWTYWLIRRREGIGLGDAKLMAMLGAWLGLSGALLSFAIGILLGAVFALLVLAMPAARRESDTWLMSKLPLGTFLCVGGIISALWGQPIIAAYLRLVGL